MNNIVTISDKKQLQRFLENNKLYKKPETSSISKPTEFGENIYIGKIDYNPKLEFVGTTYQNTLYFLSFNISKQLMLRYMINAFKNITGYDFASLIKRKARGGDTNDYKIVPYTKYDLRSLNQTNGPYNFLPNGNSVHVITNYDVTTGKFITATWKFDLDNKASNSAICFILRDLNQKYWQKIARTQKDQQQVQKIKRDIANNARLINKYFTAKEKANFIKRLQDN